jgi:myo-inositol-1-phosphate synthase
MSARLGVWFIGAKGGVATTSIVGLLALKYGLTGNAGLVSQHPEFGDLNLVDWNEIVIGGHDIRECSLVGEAEKLHSDSRIIAEHVLEKCRPELQTIDARIRPGVILNVGKTITAFATDKLRALVETPQQAIDRVQADLKEFKSTNNLERVIVVNLASTEPPADTSKWPTVWSELQPQLADDQFKVPSSTLYAIATLDLGYPYINFTPSVGSAPAAIDDLARQRDTCHMGHDGKTGETLLKSALAPMFAHRNLPVMSWVGHNIFGNMDGKVLDDPENKKTKVTSKDRLLGEILGYHPQTHISIEYIESLGDWKTAWDHIHFQGFLGTPMVMQFTWQGCDSILAAPLVIDLLRFTERAASNGQTGLLTFLASFFKSPLGVRENNFERQYQMLLDWAAGLGK